jgi:hypothetical protein
MFIDLHLKYHYSCHISMKLEFKLTDFMKNIQIPNFMKICTVGIEFLHVDGWTDRHDEYNTHSLQFHECAN